MHQKEYNIDQINREILGLMQNNARIANAGIARKLNMAPSAVLERIKKLEQKNVILQYIARLNPIALQQNQPAYVFIKSADGSGCSSKASELSKVPEVQEVHRFAGDNCYLVRISKADSASFMELMRNKLSKISNFLSTKTTIVPETVKEQQQLVIPAL
jgi:Lrp/AsnC family leucine-responsive transcriptional regulator